MQKFPGLTRREFLKLISLAPVGIYSHPFSKAIQAANSVPSTPARALGASVIIIVFDAWSQHNVSLYGYPRPTMPNLEEFCKNAIVYHNHYSAGTFTVPGTSSLLTGMYPWSHRAFHLGAGIASSHIEHTLFSALPSHSTLAYTQNELADQILHQLQSELDHHLDARLFDLQDENLYTSPLFQNDIRMAFAGLNDNITRDRVGFDASLFFGPLYRLGNLRSRERGTEQYADRYPRGMPESPALFLLDDIVEGAIGILSRIQHPTVAYFHFLPPHDPYAPTKEFFESFIEGWNPSAKPVHELSDQKTNTDVLHLNRRYYDEFIASWDHEVARLFQYLTESGLVENNYIIVTADHGELFERGEMGHVTKLIYDPLIRIPLIISRPGQSAREDVHTITSSVDLLPTIAHLIGNPIPEWSEGRILPNLGGEADEGRSVFSMDAKFNSSFGPLVNYSMSLTRGHHRLTYYCYSKDNYQKYEFYDLTVDPGEVNDLYSSSPASALDMQDELLQRVDDANQPFRNGS
ncbi:MAG: sulfatase family protein [Anaerolineales bacterium]